MFDFHGEHELKSPKSKKKVKRWFHRFHPRSQTQPKVLNVVPKAHLGHVHWPKPQQGYGSSIFIFPQRVPGLSLQLQCWKAVASTGHLRQNRTNFEDAKVEMISPYKNIANFYLAGTVVVAFYFGFGASKIHLSLVIWSIGLGFSTLVPDPSDA